MEDRSVEIVRAVYEAFGRDDVQAVLGAMSNELEWYEAEGMPYGSLYRTREAVAEGFRPAHRGHSELRGIAGAVHRVGRHGGSGRPLHRAPARPLVSSWTFRSCTSGIFVTARSRFGHFVDTAKFLEVVPAEIATS